MMGPLQALPVPVPVPILESVASIGRYEIKREIGRGAMGVVYLAHDPRLHRQVAVKTYALPDGISDELAKEFRERFHREAQAAASLSHPGIVTIFDAGEDPATNLPFIAMEFVQGESLKQRLEKGDPLASSWVVGFGAVLAEALHVAHRAGIVHRDIKPANILIREGDGAVKIADFGVARLKASDLTRSGGYLGSPGYMSPEQIRSGSLDGRSDLFALAVVLYEALCGKRPFHGEDLVSLAYSIAHDTQVPLSRQLRGCPPELDTFFDRALSKDPGKRFADGAAFRDALLSAGRQAPAHSAGGEVMAAATMGMAPAASVAGGTVLETRPVAGAAGARRGGRGRLIGLALAGTVLIAAGVGAALYLRNGRPSPPRIDARSENVRPPATAGAGTQGPSQEQVVRQDPPPRPGQTPARAQAALTDVAPVPKPPRVPRLPKVTVPQGTEVRLALDGPVGSSMSHVGDTFTARVTDPVIAGDRVAMPAGSIVHGRVSEVTPAKKGLSGKQGALGLTFDKVVTPSGFGAPVSAGWSGAGSGSGGKNAKIIGGTAVGGALLGKMLGKNSKDARVGAALGGAIGTGIAAGTKGEDVDLPAGSALTIKLEQPLTIQVNP